MINCPNCENLNDEDNQFCGKCGAKLPNPKYCPLGHYKSYTDDFCTKCGEKLISKEEYEEISQKISSLLQKAREFKDKKDCDEALKCFDEILYIQPNHILSLMEKTHIYGDLGKFKEAIECCDKRIEIDSQDKFALLFKGNYLGELGKFEEAIECYDKSILIDFNYHSPYISKGKALLELNKFDDALYCFDKALKIKNDDPIVWDIIIGKLINLFKFEEAMDYCNRALNYHPDNISLNYKKAILLGLNNEYLKANDLISKYSLNGAGIFNTVANAFNLMGEYNKAKRFCNKSLDLNQQFCHSWLTMGEIYFNLKKYDESLKYFKKGFELSSEDNDTVINGLIKECQEFVKSNLNIEN